MFFQQPMFYHLANEESNDLFEYMKMIPLGYYGAQTLLLSSDMVSVLMQAKKLLTYRTCSYVQHVILANGNDVLSIITVDGVDSTFKNSVSKTGCCAVPAAAPHICQHLELCLHHEEPYSAVLGHFSVCDTWLRVCSHFETLIVITIIVIIIIPLHGLVLLYFGFLSIKTQESNVRVKASSKKWQRSDLLSFSPHSPDQKSISLSSSLPLPVPLYCILGPLKSLWSILVNKSLASPPPSKFNFINSLKSVTL